eukprot:1629-Heterococcus_DN1.PRE.2
MNTIGSRDERSRPHMVQTRASSTVPLHTIHAKGLQRHWQPARSAKSCHKAEFVTASMHAHLPQSTQFLLQFDRTWPMLAGTKALTAQAHAARTTREQHDLSGCCSTLLFTGMLQQELAAACVVSHIYIHWRMP